MTNTSTKLMPIVAIWRETGILWTITPLTPLSHLREGGRGGEREGRGGEREGRGGEGRGGEGRIAVSQARIQDLRVGMAILID